MLLYAFFFLKQKKIFKCLVEVSHVVGSSWMNIKIDIYSDVVCTKHLLFFFFSRKCPMHFNYILVCECDGLFQNTMLSNHCE